MPKSTTLTVQQWGNSLAVRIPAAVAKSARFKVGQPVEVSAQDSNVLVKPIGEPRLTLAQKLAAFDPEMHGGEAWLYSRSELRRCSASQEELVPGPAGYDLD